MVDPKKKIVELTAEELADLGYLTDKVAPGVRKRVERVLSDPKYLGGTDIFLGFQASRSSWSSARSAGTRARPPPLRLPTPPTSTASDADTLFSRYSSNSLAFTVVTPDLITKYESDFYYNGLSGSPPPLLWRSDLEENPFPAPVRGDRHFSIPVKTAHGVIGTPLNAVWPAVAPAILASLKSRGIKYSAVQPVRFSIVDGDRDEYLGPVVVWIAIPPNSSGAGAVRDATPDILRILTDAQITNVVVEWYQGTIKKLADPPLVAVEYRTSAARSS
ncbi:hypothetical protein HMN09_00701900 [Mycena chlorophos]|uniref:Uncharacterized protein n=1 Tax=Mycena chlorophos TaxID=658473 RepID=A0A8H6T069_MYCCL|nr:hypothetical protein HMN09_00701900 [Mycena chlorophos]